MEYEKMLDEGIRDLPKDEAAECGRFEIPKVSGHIQGNKTVITNLGAIISLLRRDEGHFIKFLLKELASPGHFDGPRFVFGRKLNPVLINDKIKRYAELFVICSKCLRPDTQIIEKEGKTYLKCTACGAQVAVKM